MNFRFGAYVFMMFGLAALMTACGGGGGGGGITPITVTSAKNPVLENTAVTITANFTNYTSTAKFGASKAVVGGAVNFSAAPAVTLSNQTTIKADYTATADAKAPAGRYAVSASYKSAAGSTTIAFIPQPGSISVPITSAKALNGLSAITCDVTSDRPVVFRKYSSGTADFAPEGSVPQASTLPVTITTVSPTLINGTLAGFNLAANGTLVNLLYNTNGTPGVPNYSIGNVLATPATPPIVPISPAPVLLITPTYYSGANGTGTKLYP